MRISPFIRPTLTLAGLGFFMLTGCYGANWLLNLSFISGAANIFVGVGFSVAFSKAAFLSLSLFYGKQGIQLVYSLYTRIKMRFFEGNQLEKAKNIWQTFNQKYQSLTGDQSEFRDRFTRLSDLNLEELQHQDPKKYEAFEKAATKIARFWKKKRISGDFISVNPNGNHSDQFHTLLNVNKKGQIDQRIKKRLSYFQDQALLNDIQTANWNASRFRKGETHHSAFSLFASNKIDFHQKSTVSDIIETAAVFGDFVAYPILDQHGQFTKEAKQYLLPELRGSKLAGLVRKFNTRDMENFRNLVQCLPRSEQFIFVFKNQKTVDGQHLPSSDKSEFRVQLATTAPYWLLNAEVRIEKTVPNWAKPVFRYILGYVANIFPIPFNYDGVLKLSFGARNAMGLALYGKEWEPLIPRIGRQSIDDIEHFSKQFSRPGPSPESYHFGIVPSNENLHSITVEYTESIAHDDYHRTKRSIENHEKWL